MNIVELEYFDKANKYGAMIVNGERVHIGKGFYGKYRGFNPIYEYEAVLAPAWNRSDRTKFHAKTLKSLMAKVRKFKYRLVT